MSMAPQQNLLNRVLAAAGRAMASVSVMARVAAANLWRDRYNPLRGLSMSRAVRLLEDEKRGAYADLQWTYEAIEGQDATLGALVEARTSAIQELDWNIKVQDDLPEGKEAVARKQELALRQTYERIGNLSAAIEFLALATFRGFSHLEIVTDAQGRITKLDPIEQWYWVRQGLHGEWQLNVSAASGRNTGEEVDLSRFVIRECKRPVNRVALVCFVRKGLSQKDWDGFIEQYGIPGVFIVMSTDVSDDDREDYLALAEQSMGGGSGVLPGGSDVKTVDNGARGANPFRDHLKYQDECLVLRGTGGKLTMLAESGSGNLAGGAHQEAFDKLARAEAKEISEVLRAQIDRQVIDRVTPGEPVFAYFELAANEETDTTAIVDDVVKLTNAGYVVKPDWVEEKTAYPVTRVESTGAEESGSHANPTRTHANRPAGESGVNGAENPDDGSEAKSDGYLNNRDGGAEAPSMGNGHGSMGVGLTERLAGLIFAELGGGDEALSPDNGDGEESELRNAIHPGDEVIWITKYGRRFPIKKRRSWAPSDRPKGTGNPNRRTVVNSIREVLDETFVNPDSYAEVSYAAIDAAETQRIEGRTGAVMLRLEGVSRGMSAESVRKMMVKHSQDTIPLTESVLMSIPRLVTSNRITRQVWQMKGAPTLRTEVDTKHGTLIIVEQYQKSQGKLMLKSAYYDNPGHLGRKARRTLKRQQRQQAASQPNTKKPPTP